MERFELSILMAYADGELDAEAAEEVEAYLDESEEARETVEALRRGAGLARAAFNEPVGEAVPERLMATVLADPPRRTSRPSLRLAAAVLAGLVIGAGGAVGLYRGTAPAGPVLTAADLTLRDGTLQHTLEKKVSGTDVQWRNPDTGHSGIIQPIRTLERPDGVFCRQYRETTTLGKVADLRFGIACRQADGAWKIRYEVLPKEERTIVH